MTVQTRGQRSCSDTTSSGGEGRLFAAWVKSQPGVWLPPQFPSRFPALLAAELSDSAAAPSRRRQPMEQTYLYLGLAGEGWLLALPRQRASSV